MDTNLNMQRMPIDQLKPAKYNPRKDLKPGDPAYEKIKRSLHDFGYVDPIASPLFTAAMAGSASGFIRTNHCLERRLSTTSWQR